MIIATLATYPPRLPFLANTIACLVPQVDLLNIVLNEYTDIPAVCQGVDKVNSIIPPSDTKDTGKFLPQVEPQDWLFTVDDDIIYPPDYVSKSIADLTALGDQYLVGGYHGSIYTKHPRLQSRLLRRILRRNPNFIVGQREIFGFSFAQEAPVIVDQLGTGVSFMRGSAMPAFAEVQHGQKFVDAAAARYWHRRGISLVCLARAKSWIDAVDPIGETIVDSFTFGAPTYVADEIYNFAYKNPHVRKDPRTLSK